MHKILNGAYCFLVAVDKVASTWDLFLDLPSVKEIFWAHANATTVLVVYIIEVENHFDGLI